MAVTELSAATAATVEMPVWPEMVVTAVTVVWALTVLTAFPAARQVCPLPGRPEALAVTQSA